MNKKLVNIITIVAMATSITIDTIPLKVAARGIEPQLCYVETWTSEYWIDDNEDILYPYLDCKAEVYDDGNVVIHFWNTHKWDDSDKTIHRITPIGLSFLEWGYEIIERDNLKNIDDFKKKGLCYYYDNGYNSPGTLTTELFNEYTHYDYKINDGIYFDAITQYYGKWKLSDLPVGDGSQTGFYSDNSIKLGAIFYPETEPTPYSYDFYIFGHEFTITSEMLQTTLEEKQMQELKNQVSTLTKENELLNQKIKQLTEENDKLSSLLATVEELKEEMLSLKKVNQSLKQENDLLLADRNHPMDVNADGVVNALDIIKLKKLLLES